MAERALVTGANRGIGRELALGLAAEGFDIAVLGRNVRGLREVAERCVAAGVRATVTVADVTDREQVRRAVTDVEYALGGVDLLVNNAGVIEAEEVPFVEADVDEAWRAVEVNLRGAMLVIHAVLPGMLGRGTGRVVNLNSGSGYRPMRAYTGYAIGKGALARLTHLVETQYGASGVHAFDVAPGRVETDMTRSMPMHAGRTEWTPTATTVDLVTAIGQGRLDELGGRFFRAGADTVDSLLAAADKIVNHDARVLRLVPIDEEDAAR